MVAFLALSEARTVHRQDSERSAVYKSILVSEMWTALFVCTPSRSRHIWEAELSSVQADRQ